MKYIGDHPGEADKIAKIAWPHIEIHKLTLTSRGHAIKAYLAINPRTPEYKIRIRHKEKTVVLRLSKEFAELLLDNNEQALAVVAHDILHQLEVL